MMGLRAHFAFWVTHFGNIDMIETFAQAHSARSCMACEKYSTCNDPKKSIPYSCGKFVPVSVELPSSKKKSKRSSDSGIDLDPFGLGDHDIWLPENAKNPIKILTEADEISEFDLAKQVLDVISSKDKSLSRDLKVPDGDFPQAPNFYTFCTSPKYLKSTPYAWQIIIPTIYLTEFCPRCTDQDYLFDNWKPGDSYTKIEKKVAFLEYGVCPHCGARRSKLFKKEEINFYEEAAICLGQRSGKSVNLGDVAAYVLHMQIKLQNVNEVYSLKQNSELHGTFVALTYGQAKDTLWDPFYNNLIDSPWYTSYTAMLDQVGNKYGEQLYNLKDSFVTFRHRHLKMYPAGPDKRVLRGRTRFFACLTADSLVSTSAGLKRIDEESIKRDTTHVGDKHFGITDWARTGIKNVFRTRLENGMYVDTTANHELKTQRGWIRQDQVTNDDYLLVSLGGKFPEKEMQVQKGTNSFLDTHVACRFAHSYFEKAGVWQTAGDFDFMMPHEPAHMEAFVPEALLRSTEGLHWDFLHAFFTRGKHIGVEVRHESYRLLHQVQLMLLRVGVLSTVSYKADAMNNATFLRIDEESTLRFFARGRKEPYAPTKWVKVSEIFPAGTAYVYDITVDDEDHGFTANGIVVHNSVDEMGWFPNGADAAKLVKMNADEIYKALGNSLRTVRSAADLLIRKGFDNIPTAMFVNLSSPSSVRDKIMELVRQSQTSRKIFGIQLATWDVNPTMKRSMFDEEFSRDPVGAMRDFGAQPPISNSPLLSNTDKIFEASTKKKNPIKIAYKTKTSSSGQQTRYAKVLKMRTGGPPSIMAIDAGYVNNSFACAIGYMEDEKNARIHALIEVQPLPGVPLNYTLIYKHLLGPVIEGMNVKLVCADRWNSIKLLQDAEEEFDIKQQQYMLKYKDLVLFKDYFESGQIRFPHLEWDQDQIAGYDQSTYPAPFKENPVEHFVLQCMTVQDTGTQVLKGDQLTDDLARASMLLLNRLQDEENQAYLDSFSDMKSTNRVNVMQGLVYRSYQGAMGSTKTGAGKSSSGRVIGMARQRGNM